MEEDDDSFWKFLSATRPLGAANEPADDMAANVDAIYSLSLIIGENGAQGLVRMKEDEEERRDRWAFG